MLSAQPIWDGCPKQCRVASSWSTITSDGQLARKTLALEGSGRGCNSRPMTRTWLCVTAGGRRNLASTTSQYGSLRGALDPIAPQAYRAEALFQCLPDGRPDSPRRVRHLQGAGSAYVYAVEIGLARRSLAASTPAGWASLPSAELPLGRALACAVSRYLVLRHTFGHPSDLPSPCCHQVHGQLPGRWPACARGGTPGDRSRHPPARALFYTAAVLETLGTSLRPSAADHVLRLPSFGQDRSHDDQQQRATQPLLSR
jgi:hypothetical protein